MPGTTQGSSTKGMHGDATTAEESSEATSDATSSSTTTPVADSSGVTMEYPQSCHEIQLDNPGAASGRYEIAPANATMETPIVVYCDMVTDGGGWTLVARSVGGGFDQGQFGWGSERGDIEDPSIPYSLNAKAAGLEFAQVLVGNQGAGFDWGGHVYRFDVDPGFLELDDAAVDTKNLVTITGDCEGPAMLEHTGYTADTRVYWFRDETGFERFGLWHDGFDMYGPWSELSPCGHGADLHGDQGMIMVR